MGGGGSKMYTLFRPPTPVQKKESRFQESLLWAPIVKTFYYVFITTWPKEPMNWFGLYSFWRASGLSENEGQIFQLYRACIVGPVIWAMIYFTACIGFTKERIKCRIYKTLPNILSFCVEANSQRSASFVINAGSRKGPIIMKLC